MEIKFYPKDEKVIIPSKRREDAGYDVYAYFEEDFRIILPHQTRMIPTGLHSVIESGYYAQIQERGSTGSKGIKYSAGVIDAGYRNEWFIALTNTNSVPVIISKLDKDFLREALNDKFKGVLEIGDFIHYPYEKGIAQFIIHPVIDSTVSIIDETTLRNAESERGLGSLGSSGK